MAVALALLAAACYGASDFAGGLGGRRAAPFRVAAVGLAVGLAVVVAAAALGPGGGPTGGALGWGAVAGLGSGVGTLALYRGLAGGRMSVVAPLSAVLAALVPALAGVAAGDRLTVAAWVGVAVALAAIALVSVAPGSPGQGHRTPGQGQGTPGPGRETPGPDPGTGGARAGGGAVRDGLLAGLGFGVLFAALGYAGTGSGAWPLVPAQGVALAVVGAVLLAAPGRPDRAGSRAGWRAAVRPGAVAGALAGAATVSYLAATGSGALTVVAVLTALYPAVTVLAARVVLGERWGPVQAAGMVVAAVAVVLVSTG